MMLRVYEKNATDFSNNGLAVLDGATNVLISRELNGEFKLSFDYPVNSDKWQYLRQRNKIVCEGQQFRIYQKSREKAGTMTRSVECLHVIADASQKFIPYLAPQIGHTPRSIMLTAFAGTDFHIMTDAEVAALGMQWITDLTDIMETSKTNPMEIVKQLIENLGRGELYIDNYNIALVERIGKDIGLYCTLSNNLQSLGDTEEGSNIITRLYAYGKDGLPLPSDVAPGGYIDSAEGIANYGVCEGFIDYDTVEDPQELYQRALWEFSPNNPMRIDMPDLSYSVKLIELNKLYGNNFKLSLGDSIRIKDADLGIDTVQRIVKYSYYPYSPQESEVVLGRPPKTVMDLLKSTANASAQYQKTTKPNGQVKAEWLENLIKNLQQEVYNGLTKELTLHKTGDLWEFGNNSAIAIVDGVLAIANSRNPDGTWNFRTFGDGNGFTADLINAGTINGIEIIGSLINGATIFGGVINVFTDAIVGEALRLYKANNPYVVFKNMSVTNGQKSLMIGRETTVGAGITNLDRVDIFAGWLYVYNNLYVASNLSIGGLPAATQDYVNSIVSNAIANHIAEYHS
ncbi:phage tail spike protein [Clostridium thermosuccinogenes]|uniref:phage tail spike protein n=1 Tax=Clostridium thermosuccinogenes TaxID=84032 RepID=UPI002FD8F134